MLLDQFIFTPQLLVIFYVSKCIYSKLRVFLVTMDVHFSNEYFGKKARFAGRVPQQICEHVFCKLPVLVTSTGGQLFFSS